MFIKWTVKMEIVVVETRDSQISKTRKTVVTIAG